MNHGTLHKSEDTGSDSEDDANTASFVTYSTASTGSTADNISGAGRTVGRWFDAAGRPIERGLGRAAWAMKGILRSSKEDGDEGPHRRCVLSSSVTTCESNAVAIATAPLTFLTTTQMLAGTWILTTSIRYLRSAQMRPRMIYRGQNAFLVVRTALRVGNSSVGRTRSRSAAAEDRTKLRTGFKYLPGTSLRVRTERMDRGAGRTKRREGSWRRSAGG